MPSIKVLAEGRRRTKPFLYYSRVAQLVEQLAVNQWVAGSSPAAGAIIVMLLLYKDLKSIFKGSYSKKNRQHNILFAKKSKEPCIYRNKMKLNNKEYHGFKWLDICIVSND